MKLSVRGLIGRLPKAFNLWKKAPTGLMATLPPYQTPETNPCTWLVSEADPTQRWQNGD